MDNNFQTELNFEIPQKVSFPMYWDLSDKLNIIFLTLTPSIALCVKSFDFAQRLQSLYLASFFTKLCARLLIDWLGYCIYDVLLQRSLEVRLM